MLSMRFLFTVFSFIDPLFAYFQEKGETVHVVSMQKNFHVACYKCEVHIILSPPRSMSNETSKSID